MLFVRYDYAEFNSFKYNRWFFNTSHFVFIFRLPHNSIKKQKVFKVDKKKYIWKFTAEHCDLLFCSSALRCRLNILVIQFLKWIYSPFETLFSLSFHLEFCLFSQTFHVIPISVVRRTERHLIQHKKNLSQRSLRIQNYAT